MANQEKLPPLVESALRSAADAMGIALSSKGVTLTSNPPQDAWQYNRASERLVDARKKVQDALDEHAPGAPDAEIALKG